VTPRERRRRRSAAGLARDDVVVAVGGADKIIVLDGARLRANYGTTGTRRVAAAVDRLIDADDDRGMHTRRVDVSSAR
jgi:hypothetical protein